MQILPPAHMNDSEDQIFYVGQKAFIDKDGEVLVLNDPIEGLDFPGGKIQIGDNSDFLGALKREVREETGLEVEVGDPFITGFFEFNIPEHRNFGKKVYLVCFKCKYKNGEIVLSHEHNNFKWVNASNYKEVDDHTDFFKMLEKYFTNS